jgi:hypothetical protein
MQRHAEPAVDGQESAVSAVATPWVAMASRPSQPARPADRPEAEMRPDWCLDADTRDHVIARRNVLTGLWAGELLGLAGSDLARYAAGMHRADFEVPGDADIVAALLRDLGQAGVPMTDRVVRQKLAAFHRQALVQTHCTD